MIIKNTSHVKKKREAPYAILKKINSCDNL